MRILFYSLLKRLRSKNCKEESIINYLVVQKDFQQGLIYHPFGCPSRNLVYIANCAGATNYEITGANVKPLQSFILT